MNRHLGRIGKGFLAGALLTAALPLAASRPMDQEDDFNRSRKFAEAQHEIVVLLIMKENFSQALIEANKIFALKWPQNQEPVLLKELLGFSDQFRHHKQPDLALRLLEANLKIFKSLKSQASIWMDKGYILEGMGRHDDAIECFKEAQRLEKTIREPLSPCR